MALLKETQTLSHGQTNLADGRNRCGGKCATSNRCQLPPCHISQIVSFAPNSACRESRKSRFSTAVFSFLFMPTFSVTSLSSSPSPPKKEKQFYSTLPLFLFQSNSLFPLSLTATTTFCNNEFVSEGRSEQRSGRRKKKKRKEKESERERGIERK